MTYLKIAEHYDSCFKKHGDTHLGVDWPNETDAQIRYQVMEDVIKFSSFNGKGNSTTTLLDFGCGSAQFFDYITQSKNKFNLLYSGLDINSSYIEYCTKKHRYNEFYQVDVLNSNAVLPSFDFIIFNGVFTEKCDLSYDQMMNFFKQVLIKMWNNCEYGMAFNLMSKHVDWERDDLFHVSIDELGWFLKNNLSRNFIIRNDYGLYEYTTYVYKK